MNRPTIPPATRKWIRDEFRNIGYDPNLTKAQEAIADAAGAVEAGLWRRIQLEIDDDYGDKYIALKGERPETDQEYSIRCERDTKWALEQEKRELAELERLTRKYQEKK